SSSRSVESFLSRSLDFVALCRNLITRDQLTGSVAKLVEKLKGVKIRRVEPQLAPAGRRVPEDDAMESDSSSEWQGKGALEELLRERIRTTIESIVDEELVAALGAAR